MASSPARPLLLLSLACGLACGPKAPGETTDTTDAPSGTSAPDPGSTATTSPTGSTTSDEPVPVTTTANPTTGILTTGVLTTDDSGDTTGNSESFIVTPDGGSGPACAGVASKDCDPWTQDCPSDSKCTPSSGSCDEFSRTICSELPAQPVPVGGACISEDDPLSGRNDCELGATCWFVDPDALTGTCVGLCKGSPDVPDCSHVPDSTCVFVHGDGVAPMCLPTCHPFVPTCPSGHHCHPTPHAPDNFACIPAGADPLGAVFNICEEKTGCAEGLLCAEADTAAVECEPGSTCCTPLCDLDAPVCPGVGQVCLAYYPPGQSPPGFENVGRCGLP
ncbi:hypothetical protein [Nannocystis radixulma]|uniref:Uncharacterized protein n=1 Tax=Nannocystis radixulma TaxID=2995305 RepID=A0ABT5BJS6_9BACT|nr:hypothetical protein [Nannocystis radixulma]MDC0673191.1 hypothetical protein [Nannocystis radixulma]